MKTDDYYKKFLLEADLKEVEFLAAKKILNHLHSHPEIMAHQGPPPGYEEHLLAALKRKLPEPKVKVKKALRWSRFRPLWEGWGWAAASAMAAVFIYVMTAGVDFSGQSKQPHSMAQKDFVELVGADSDSAQIWLATVADSGFRVENSMSDLHGIARQISKDEGLQKKLNRVIAQWGI